MRLPYFPSWDNTPVTVTITSRNIAENGDRTTLGTYSGKCNYVNKTKTVFTKDGRRVDLSGYLTIRGDIYPSIPDLSGTVTIEGQTRDIYSAEKVRNPDGSVNHTRLELL